jgi:hypothetical protein
MTTLDIETEDLQTDSDAQISAGDDDSGEELPFALIIELSYINAHDAKKLTRAFFAIGEACFEAQGERWAGEAARKDVCFMFRHRCDLFLFCHRLDMFGYGHLYEIAELRDWSSLGS